MAEQFGVVQDSVYLKRAHISMVKHLPLAEMAPVRIQGRSDAKGREATSYEMVQTHAKITPWCRNTNEKRRHEYEERRREDRLRQFCGCEQTRKKHVHTNIAPCTFYHRSHFGSRYTLGCCNQAGLLANARPTRTPRRSRTLGLLHGDNANVK